MYVKSEFQAIYCRELTGYFETYDALYVKVNTNNFNSTKKPLYVGAYYRHCKAKGIMPFIQRFDDDISHKLLRKSDIIIVGDFNICLMKSTYNNDSLLFLVIISRYYFSIPYLPIAMKY